MASYKERVAKDLEGWIRAGHVAPEKRDVILATLPDTRRLDAAAALAWVGAVLLGVAVIAFIAANWDGMNRATRFAMVLIAFLSCASAAAWAAANTRPLLTNILLTIAALVFAAAVGLTGQIFDITGDPRVAAYISGVAAFALAFAGGSPGAACVGLVLIGLGDITDRHWFSGLQADAPLMLLAGPLGVHLAFRWSSSPLAHTSAIGIIFCFAWFAAQFDSAGAGVMIFLSIMLAAMAALARWLRSQDRDFASVFYGWFATAAALFFAVAVYLPWFDAETGGVMHRLMWLIMSGALIALGRFDRHLIVTATGAISFTCAISALLLDLGVSLMTAAGVFFACAIISLVAGLALKRRRRDA